MATSAQSPARVEDEAVARLWTALHDVEDPEFPLSIVDMGLVVDVQKVGHTAQLKMTFTAMGCPCMDIILEDTKARLLQEPDVDQVDIQVVWSPVWTKERLSEQGREIMLLNGVTI
jgi:metal-sulfur cluster biosynthetic enzyme